MITCQQDVRALTNDLSSSAWTLAAIGALYESGLADQLREPRKLEELTTPGLSQVQIERCLAVVVASGMVLAEDGRYRLSEGGKAFLQQPMRASLQGEIRSSVMQAAAYLDAATRDQPTVGWQHEEPALLQAQGDASAGFAPMFKAMLIPQLGDLGARLERPGARFLDVGVGVGALAISMANAFPALRTVGVDARETPLALARQNIARAQLGDRIELRKLAVEELRDEDSFELAWLPSFFIAGPMAAAIARVREALRPGGWLLLCTFGEGDARQRAVSGLINELWGGPQLTVAEAERLLENAGLSAIRALPGPAWGPRLLVGQRPA